jgi:hypothetical protein
MNYPVAPNGGIAASLGQATGYQAENYHRPKGRGIKASSTGGGLISWTRFQSKPDADKRPILLFFRAEKLG